MTPKQEAFVREYLIDLNATQAAIRAGYSAHVANRIASENLSKPVIASAIAAAQQNRAERTEITADWVLKRLYGDATADMADLYDEYGQLKPVEKWPMVWRQGLVAGIETVQERDGADADGNPTFVTVRKVKLADRTRLIELLGKHVNIGAFRERIDVSVSSIAERIKRAEERTGDA